MLLSRCPDFSVTWLDLLINAFYWAPKYGSIIKISPNHHITHHKSSHQSSKILTTLNEKKKQKTDDLKRHISYSWVSAELPHVLGQMWIRAHAIHCYLRWERTLPITGLADLFVAYSLWQSLRLSSWAMTYRLLSRPYFFPPQTSIPPRAI